MQVKKNFVPGGADEMNNHSGSASCGSHSSDIRVEYHPNSGHAPETFLSGEFGRVTQGHGTLVDPEPWAPFRTREDFEFAKIARNTRMAKKDANDMINLFHRCTKDGSGPFTLSSFDEMRNTLKAASEQLPKVLLQTPSHTIFPDTGLFKFEKKTISVAYKKKPHEFDVWVRPIWSWIRDMLQDPDLIQHFVWDACHMSKFDEKSDSWIRLYDEPWTADQFWEIQVC